MPVLRRGPVRRDQTGACWAGGGEVRPPTCRDEKRSSGAEHDGDLATVMHDAGDEMDPYRADALHPYPLVAVGGAPAPRATAKRRSPRTDGIIPAARSDLSTACTSSPWPQRSWAAATTSRASIVFSPFAFSAGKASGAGSWSCKRRSCRRACHPQPAVRPDPGPVPREGHGGSQRGDYIPNYPRFKKTKDNQFDTIILSQILPRVTILTNN